MAKDKFPARKSVHRFCTAKERWIRDNVSRGVADMDVVWLPRTGVRPQETLSLIHRALWQRSQGVRALLLTIALTL